MKLPGRASLERQVEGTGSRGRHSGGAGRWEQCEPVHSQASGLAYLALCPPALPYWLLQLEIPKSSLCPRNSVRLRFISVPVRLHYLPTAVRQGRGRFNPWVRKMPWRRKWQPTPVFLPGKSHRQRSLGNYNQRGAESDMTESLSMCDFVLSGSAVSDSLQPHGL